jgi:hypothetical protein
MAMSVSRHSKEEGLKKIVLRYSINAKKKERRKKVLEDYKSDHNNPITISPILLLLLQAMMKH